MTPLPKLKGRRRRYAAFAAIGFAADGILSVVMLLRFSDKNPVLDWFDYQFGVVGVMLYFAALGLGYRLLLSRVGSRLVPPISVGIFVMHLAGAMSWLPLPALDGFPFLGLVLLYGGFGFAAGAVLPRPEDK